ncbi:MBL fold metallo-hydrolase [Streptomyces sp. BHT-5-2]|uniref:MBL fold metallo-hydrolase n=1 Tax=Streptomyces sp. BHT-5-2 TaxID=2866715 RepID=UPI001C8D3091|nr:MBL fold metallo-hydrolase [Streptomyces sp. BHT-5-2]QZL02436.1 MBL fold metallo-hydrolase [Streptomyces sp. BHT-5-2]
MHFAQYYLDCLSQASYLIGDQNTGRAVLVDPRRDIDEYLADAEAAGLRIELVVETHIHADFLSGHLEAARATGAEIAFGAAAETGFPIRRLHDGERIFLGPEPQARPGTGPGSDPAPRSGVTLTVLATPGHTLESICLVVRENPDDDVPFGVLTGDTLFIGDVGRPDLLSAAGHSPQDMAARLHRSLHTKLLPLPDATRIFPAHGAGSACGRSISTETSSTLGDQRRLNYALQPMTQDAFVRLVTAEQPATPGYFAHDVALNRDGHPLRDPAPPAPLTLDEALTARATQGAALLDCRPAAEYIRAHLAGSLHSSLDTRFAEYAGSVVAPGTPLVLLAAPGKEDEARLRLARIGYDRVLGHLPDPAGVLAAAPELTRRSNRLRMADLLDRLPLDPEDGPQLVDVRNPAEYAAGALPGARNIPLAALADRLDELDPARPVILYCRSGNRSLIAAALLEAHGFIDVSDVSGGYTEAAALV